MLFFPVYTAVGKHVEHLWTNPRNYVSLILCCDGSEADHKLGRNTALSWSWELGPHPSCCFDRLNNEDTIQRDVH